LQGLVQDSGGSSLVCPASDKGTTRDAGPCELGTGDVGSQCYSCRQVITLGFRQRGVRKVWNGIHCYRVIGNGSIATVGSRGDVIGHRFNAEARIGQHLVQCGGGGRVIGVTADIPGGWGARPGKLGAGNVGCQGNTGSCVVTDRFGGGGIG